jgi:predicted AlkP superfamily pyrophosphatase or phosphodiesterase
MNNSLTTVCAALCYALGIDAPEFADTANKQLCEFVDRAFLGEKADRVFMYNPDAIAAWVYEKYNAVFENSKKYTDLELLLDCVMPSVTPVCFATMYTGANPEIHGIQSYVKPVITIDTIFDALIRNFKKPAIVSTGSDSMSKIFLEREMDYFIFDSIEQANAKACELIREDNYDFIAVYNGNYDTVMHKFAPESSEALFELKANVDAYTCFCELIEKHWKNHNSLVGFAMDHGCHEIDGGCGSHGLDMPEDIEIVHLYKAFK